MIKNRFSEHSYLVFVSLCLMPLSAFTDSNLDKLVQSKKYAEAVNYADAKIPPASRHADVWVKVGFSNEELGYPEKALACYLVASQTDTKNFEAYIGIARIYNKMGNPQNAMIVAKKALAIKTNAESSWEFALACITLKRTDLAKEALENVVRFNPSNARACLALSEIYWKEQSFDKAVPLFKVAYDANPKAELAFKFGKALRDANKPDYALKYLKEAVEKNPAMIEANVELARAYYDKSKYLAAANEYEKIATKIKLSAMDQYYRAVSNEKTGSQEVALQAYYAAASGFGHTLSTEAVLAHLKAGNSDLEKKNFKTALAHFRFISLADSSGANVPDIQIRLAEAYLGIGDYQRSITCLEKVLSADKNNIEANLRLAELYQKTGFLDRAHAIFEKCLSITPNDPRIFLALGDYESQLKNYVDALGYYEKSYLLNRNVKAAEGRALTSFELSQCEKTIEAAQSALAINPSLFELRSLIYRCSMKNKNFQEAREQLDSLVVKKPMELEYWRSLAVCCVNLKDSLRCSYADKNILRLDKNNIESLQRLGFYQLSKKDTIGAYATFQKLETVMPKNIELLRNLCTLAMAIKNKVAALGYLKKYCVLRPGDVPGKKSLGDLYYDLKDYDAAIVHYREAVKLDPTIKGLYKPYIRLLMAKVMKTELENVLASAIKAGEADAELCAQLGAFFEIQMQFTKAIEYYDKAHNIDPSDIKVASKLARCQVKMGNISDAIVTYQQIIAMDTSVTQEYKILGDLYLKQNMTDQAVEAYKKYLAKSDNNVELSLFVGRIAFETRDYEQALRFFTRIQNQISNDPQFLFMVGQAYYYTKDYANATRIFERLRNMGGKGQKKILGPMLRILADSYDKLNNKNNAIVVYAAYQALPEVKDPDAAIRMAQLQETIAPALAAKMYEDNTFKYPSEYRNYYEAARIYSKEHATYGKAEYMIRKCVAIKDTVPFLWLVLGRIYGKLNKTQQELEAFQKYIQQGTPKPEFCEEIGITLLDQALINDAMVYLEMANSLKPENPKFLYQLARGYEKINRISDAVPIIQKAAQLAPGDGEIQTLLSYITMRMEKRQVSDSGGLH